jgi:hypothetical protein
VAATVNRRRAGGVRSLWRTTALRRFRTSLLALALYAVAIGVIVLSFLAQILRGDCPVP